MIRHLLMAAAVVGFVLGGVGTAAATPTAPSTASTTFDLGTVSPLVEFLPTDEFSCCDSGGGDDDGGGGGHLDP